MSCIGLKLVDMFASPSFYPYMCDHVTMLYLPQIGIVNALCSMFELSFGIGLVVSSGCGLLL